MQEQRDQKGRYLPGHSGGPGRPKKKRDPAYMTIVEEEVTHEDWRAIIRTLKEAALNGEPQAQKLLAAYLLGRPVPAASTEDENEDPAALPPDLLLPPSQLSPAAIKVLSRQLEREKRKYDLPIASTNQGVVEKKQNRS